MQREDVCDLTYFILDWYVPQAIQHHAFGRRLACISDDQIAEVSVCGQQKFVLPHRQRKHTGILPFLVVLGNFLNIVTILAELLDDGGIHTFIRQNSHTLAPRTSSTA